MYILSLNINGARSFFQNRVQELGDLECFDIILLQETKIPTTELIQLSKAVLPNHIVFNSQSSFKSGYAGSAALVRDKLLFDGVIPSPVEIMPGYGSGRLVTIKLPKYYLVGVYTLNSGGEKKEDRKEWDRRFKDYIKYLSLSSPVVIMGDLNVVEGPLGHYDYFNNVNTLPGLYEFELENFKELLKDLDLVDVYREQNPESKAYSWFSYSGNSRARGLGWRIDYTLASKSILPAIKTAVLSEVNVSDHCPIITIINEDLL